MRKIKLFFLAVPFIVVFLLVGQQNSFAASGCCYQHGGVSSCDISTGKQACKDGAIDSSCGCVVDPPFPPENIIIDKINSVRRDYLYHHQGFRESLIQDILKLTGGNFLDTIGYYVYTKLPDIKSE